MTLMSFISEYPMKQLAPLTQFFVKPFLDLWVRDQVHHRPRQGSADSVKTWERNITCVMTQSNLSFDWMFSCCVHVWNSFTLRNSTYRLQTGHWQCLQSSRLISGHLSSHPTSCPHSDQWESQWCHECCPENSKIMDSVYHFVSNF